MNEDVAIASNPSRFCGSDDFRQCDDAILEHLNQGVSQFDAELKLVVCNTRFLDLLGFPHWMGQPGMSADVFFRWNARLGEYGPGDVETLVEERMLQARRFEAHSFERRRPDGTVIRIEGTPLPAGGFVATYTDVTNLRRSESALKVLNEELEERVVERTSAVVSRELAIQHNQRILRTVLESVTNGITLVDRDLRIQVANKTVLAMFDVPDELGQPGTPLEDVIRYHAERGEYGPGDIEEMVARRIARARRLEPHRFVHTRSNGMVIEVSGRPTADGFVTTYSDITEITRSQKRLEATNAQLEERVIKRTHQLNQAKERAEAANAAKTNFLAQMSHELRTPLNSILGFSDMMRQKVFGALGDRHYEGYADAIHSSGSHLLNLITDILEMSRIEADKVELDETAVRIGEMFDDVQEMMEAAADRKSIALRQRPGSRGDLSIRVDRMRLKQMLLNLLSNAVKFTPDAGVVELWADTTEAGQVVLAVEDSGPGISEADLAVALEPFGQIRSSSAIEGTGLGLAIVERLLRKHDGVLKIERGRHGGACVMLCLPIERLVP